MECGPNKLTMPPVAIECVRNIRREALASFWEACHVAKQNVTKSDHRWFWGLLRISFVRSLQPWKQTKTGTEVPSLTFLRRILEPIRTEERKFKRPFPSTP